MGRLTSLLLLLATLLPARPAAAEPVDRWASDIAEASLRFAIPADWIQRVIRTESSGRTMAGRRPVVSRAGAMGLMQLMPATWRDMRSLLGLGADPFDPRDNILAGAAYLRLMYDRFGYPGLFAAYNAGPGRYSAYLSGRRPLPRETRAYVSSVAATAPSNGRAGRQGGGRLFALESGPNASDRGGTPEPAASGALFVKLGSGGGRTEP